jgi:hypothetical protein
MQPGARDLSHPRQHAPVWREFVGRGLQKGSVPDEENYLALASLSSKLPRL